MKKMVGRGRKHTFVNMYIYSILNVHSFYIISLTNIVKKRLYLLF